jgi:RNA polymerase sigma factor (sigma-70 family)
MADITLPEHPSLREDEAHLFRLHFHRLVRLVQRDGGVPEDVAEDCVSFAFLQLCRKQPAGGEATVGWLRVVARHEAYAWQRGARRLRSLDECASRRTHDGEYVSVAELVRAPVDVELAVEAREALRALARLRPKRRRALALKVAGLHYREIQERLGVTYTWVNRHISEGRAELRSGRE